MSVFVEGPLKKLKSGLFGGWNEHWFRLTANGLVYYARAKPPQANEEISASIDIASGKYFRVAKEFPTAIEVMIGVNGSERSYVLNAPNVEERDKWLQGLKEWSVKSAELKKKAEKEIIAKKELQLEKTEKPRAMVDISEFEPALNQFKQSFALLHQKLCQQATPDQFFLIQENLYNLMHAPAITATFVTRITSGEISVEYKDDFYWKIASFEYKDLAKFLLSNNFEGAISMLENHAKSHRELNSISISPNMPSPVNRNSSSESAAPTIAASTSISAEGDIINALVSFMELSCTLKQFLVVLIEADIKNTESEGSLFRANSFATKVITNFVKSNATAWLCKILEKTVEQIVNSNDSFEVDPFKISQINENENPEIIKNKVDTNRVKLTATIEEILDLILSSSEHFPLQIKFVFKLLQEYVIKIYPGAKYTSICGFLFLRFLNPAFVNPALYFPSISNVTSNSRRRLLLITKVIQNLANGVKFGSKEEFMCPFNDLLDKYGKKVEKFLNDIVNFSQDENFVPTINCQKTQLELLQSVYERISKSNSHRKTIESNK